ncbi:MAG: hypothetical protein ACK5AZ_16830 [Bryobacteraceae bacterium]
MHAPQDWIPIEWPAQWPTPERLETLRGTPINCLVLAANTWKPELAERARQHNFTVVISGEMPHVPEELPQIQPAPMARIDWSTPSPVTAIRGAFWPKMRGTGTRSASGPTGSPWVDSNSWAVRLAQAVVPERPVWVTYPAPPRGTELNGEAYEIALMDAAAFGARWPVKLDAALLQGLAAGNSEATSVWSRIVRALDLLENRREWRTYSPVARIGVISDFSGPDRALGAEVLNLCTRRHMSYAPIPRSRAASADTGKLRAVLYLDRITPDDRLRARIAAFVQGGGLLVAPRETGAMLPGARPAESDHPRFELRSLGRGRIAVPREPWNDPYLIASDTHLLLSRRHDPLVLHNAGSTNSLLLASADGKRSVLQLVNYTGRAAAHPVSVTVRESVRSARIWALDAREPQTLPVRRGLAQPELHIPAFAAYAAVEWES